MQAHAVLAVVGVDLDLREHDARVRVTHRADVALRIDRAGRRRIARAVEARGRRRAHSAAADYSVRRTSRRRRRGRRAARNQREREDKSDERRSFHDVWVGAPVRFYERADEIRETMNG